MTLTEHGPRTAVPERPGRAANPIVLHYFLTNLGYFGLMSTLVVALNAAGFPAGRIAVLVMVFTLTNKIAKIPLAPWLDRISATGSVLLGCLMAAAGFAALGYVTGLPLTAVCLALAGTGISVNALASKQLAAAASDRTGARARVFSLINIGINVAAAVAAPVALYFADRHRHGLVLLAIAVVYCVAGAATYVNYSRLGVERHSAPISSWRSYLDTLRMPGLGPFLLVNLFGWFLYGQLFNVLALHVSRTLASPQKLGWLYTLNALLVVVLQLSVTRLAGRFGRGQHANTVVLAYATFVLAFLSAYLLPGYGGAVVFVVVFTVAEMMFIPSVDVVLLDLIGAQNRAVGYSVLSISTAIGEASGGGAGVASYRWFVDHRHGPLFWLVGAGLAVGFVLVTHWLKPAMARRPVPVGAAR